MIGTAGLGTRLLPILALLMTGVAVAQDYWDPPTLANRNATGSEYYMLEVPDSVTIRVDGYDDDWSWFDPAYLLTMDQWRDEGDRTLPDRADLEITTRMAWKGAPENRWYVFMHVHDDVLNHSGTEIRRWSGDMLGFALDPRDHGRTRGVLGYSQEYLAAPGNLAEPNFIERHSSATGGTGPSAWQAYGQPPYLVGVVRVTPASAWAASDWSSPTAGDTYYEWSVAVWDKFEDNGPSASTPCDLDAQAGRAGFGLPFVFWVEDGDPGLDNDMTVRGREAVDRQYFAHAVLLRASADTTDGTAPQADTTSFRIRSIEDVPNDRGGQVRVTWQRHPDDRAEAVPRVTEYRLWERSDQSQPPGAWSLVTVVPAMGVETYSAITPALANSTPAGGSGYAVFYLTASTQQVAVTHASAPDSGWAVDNLSPVIPTDFTGMAFQGQTRLVWQPATSAVAYYLVYRGSSVGFRAEKAHGMAIGGEWQEDYTATERFYRLAAVGLAGERGAVTDAVEVKPWAEEGILPGDFDEDGRVLLADFFLFADAMGTGSTQYDLDNDGRVELDDFLLFADRFRLDTRH